MMVFWKAGLVFLAVPKTGTQAYAAALGGKADMIIRHPPGLKHMNAKRFSNRLRPLLAQSGMSTVETLAVIRDPLEWLGSWYRYRGRDALRGNSKSTAAVTFDQFIEAYLSPDQPAFADVGSQMRFVSDGEGRVIVDHLFAYENQSALRGFLSARLGAAVAPPPQRNASPRQSLSLSPDLEARLRDERAADFALHQGLSR